MEFICVLNDGETYTSLEGCKLLAIEEGSDPEQIEQFLKELRGTNDSITLDKKAIVITEFT